MVYPVWNIVVVTQSGIPRSTAIMELKEWYSMQRLLSHAYQVHTNAIVYHPLFGQNHKQAINFKHTYTRGDDHRHLAGPIEVPVYVMLVEHIE